MQAPGVLHSLKWSELEGSCAKDEDLSKLLIAGSLCIIYPERFNIYKDESDLEDCKQNDHCR